MRVKLGQAFTGHRPRSLTVCLLLALILVCGSVTLIGPAFVSAQSTTARKIRLFEGFTIKIISGKLVIYGDEPTVEAPAVPSITFLQCANDGTNLTTYTFASQNTGTESADRYTVVAIAGQDNSGQTVFGVSTVTVGGDSAAEVVDQEGAGSVTTSAVYILSNPAGTSESVVVTFSEGVSDATVCLFQVNNLQSATAVDTAVAFSTDASSITLDTDTAADGIAIGICNTDNGGLNATWTGLTERVDTETGTVTYSAADFDEDGSAATPLNITCDITGTGDTTGAVASFR